jgi:NAD(P)-dependent dehydrogenase (short-subunit alcohol dehydrogenase family)
MSDQNRFASKLAGTRILIIGGSSGIGFAVAEASIEYGAATVIISGSSPERVKTATSRLSNSYATKNCQIIGFACNLKQEDSLESDIAALFDTASSNGTEKISHVVFTGGDQPAPKPISDVDFNFIKETGLVRFFAPLLVAKYASKYIAPGPASSITFTSGISSQRPYPNWNALGAYIASIDGMARSLAVELKPVRLNVISLGPVATNLLRRYYPEEKRVEACKLWPRQSLRGLSGALMTLQRHTYIA